ncbi:MULTISPECIES: beta-N-acetylhexosaminidase [unclassified Actinotalea]|uniref:beta-N-acetylhexosaminidase n=1 Tax=unclassified Actinotalea TaxID=2638618 RepID=UPI0015F4FB18|nr:MULTISPECIES: family 20 glycosylhydrolase [unclassified Actinotalea]
MSLVPWPTRVEPAPGRLEVAALSPDASWDEHWSGRCADLPALADLPLRGDGLPLRLVPRESGTTDGLPALPPLGPDGEVADERYRLRVDRTGVEVHAAGPEGAFRALTTLRQLLAAAGGVDGIARPDVAEIQDGPRYGWRGLSLDVVRTFFTVAEVMAVIDLMTLYKLNVLHLHLTDDQGWRLEVPGRPELTRTSAGTAYAGRPGGFYSTAELREIVRYAADRFVRVVPEVDIPGHSGAVLRAYPHLGRGHGEPGGYASHLHLDHRQPETFVFLQQVVDTLVDLTPGPYLHLGGDEAFGMGAEEYATFWSRFTAEVDLRGRRLVGWQELSRGGLGGDPLLQHWRDSSRTDAEGTAEMRRALGLPDAAQLALLVAAGRADVDRMRRDGNRVIVSPATVAYLDRPYADVSTDPEDVALRDALGLRLYEPMTVEEYYAWDPATVVPDLPADQVVGVEAAMWTETVASVAELQFMLLPRLAGVAEKAWSTAPRPWQDFRGRLAGQVPLWEAQGWRYFRAASVWPDPPVGPAR